MKKLKAVLVAFIVMAGLLIIPASASAHPPAHPTPWGTVPASNWQMCAPGQQNCFDRLNKSEMSCVWNDDAPNQNVAFGARFFNNPYNTYQLLVMRHWIYCADETYAKMIGVFVGDGYCMRWIRTLTIFRFDTQGNQSYSLFEIYHSSGYVEGRKLRNHLYQLNLSQANNYMISTYRC